MIWIIAIAFSFCAGLVIGGFAAVYYFFGDHR